MFRILAVVLASTLCQACGAMVTRGTLVGSHDEVTGVRSETRSTPQVSVETTSDDTRYYVEASYWCEQREVQRIERTHVFRRRSRAKAFMVALTLAGLALTAGGAVMAANVPGYPDEDELIDGDTQLSRQDGLVLGGLGLALGGAAIVTVGIHGVQVARRERDYSEVIADGPVTAAQVRCDPPRPVVGAAVTLDDGIEQVPFATTDPYGRASGDLIQLVPERWITGRNTTTVDLVVGGTHVGGVDLRPVRSRADARAWANANPTACAAPRRSDDCSGVERYLAEFPTGISAERARSMLESASETLRSLAAAEIARRELEAEARRQEIEARRLAQEQARAELERQVRLEEEARERAWLRERAEGERAAREAAARRERERDLAVCRSTCRDSCGGNRVCVDRCVRESCQ